jgi:subtilisin family serine protease
MKSKSKNVALLQLGSILTSVTLSAWVYAQNTTASLNRTLVIDQGVDFSHNKLNGFINKNVIELNGKAKIDDDHDGFVDNIAGWNSVSNDGVYMPNHVLAKFTQNPQRVKEALALYTRVENGDPTATNEIRNNPQIRSILGELLDYSHGTHVGGIVASNSVGSASLQSLNVFEGSTPQVDGEPVPTPAAAFSLANLARPLNQFKKFIRLFDTLETPDNTVVTSTPPSFLDDRAQLQKMIDEMDESSLTEYGLMSKYLQASQSTVVNLSLGIAKKNIRERVDQFWAQELSDAGLPEDTKRNQVQESNYHFIIDGIYNSSRKGWASFFSGNPNVLFVIAAGNDGEGDTSAAGDIDQNPVTPADLSIDLKNVITIAATDTAGVITDFSCFSASKVNIGAWGKAVPSLAPGNNTVSMSGTSMASPMVAGVATRLRAINPKLTAAEVRTLIEETGKPVASLKGKTTTGKMIDANAAIRAAELSVQGSFDLAILRVNNARNRALLTGQTAFNLGGSMLNLTLDTTQSGEISVTSDVVKQMIRSFDRF